MKNITIFICLILILWSPVTLLGEDPVRDVSLESTKSYKVTSNEGNFMRGITLWKNNCARCHGMRDPKDFNDYQWEVIMAHMKVRAGLPGQDARDILKFLQQSND